MHQLSVVFAQQGGNGGGFANLLVILIELVFIVAVIAGFWKTFEKAGKPGWAAVIPIYNFVVLLEIVGKPIWWVVLMLIPCVNVVISVIVALEVAKVFGKSGAFAIGLVFLPFIFYPILGFGDAQYRGPAASN